MNIQEINDLFDIFNEIRKDINKAKMNMSIGWIGAATLDLDEIEKKIQETRQHLVIKKITDTLTNTIEEL